MIYSECKGCAELEAKLAEAEKERETALLERDEARAACAALMAVVQAAEHVAEWVKNTKDEIQRKSEMSWLRRQYAMIRSGDKPFNDLSELVCRATLLYKKVCAMKGCK